MNINELMINDLVIKPFNQIHKISKSDFSRHKDWFDLVIPISLTAEILEKNLEKECEDTIDGGWYFNAENSRIWGILDDKGFWLNFNGQQDMILIHYVHQLQHALRLCGLNDLADNFII